MSRDVIVLGAGMVGTCTALALVLRGHRVTLMDRREPGRETSYGNAGIIQCDAVEPYPFPRDISTLLRVAGKRGADVNYHISALPALALPLMRYWRNSAPHRHARLAQAYAALSQRSVGEHEHLITLTGTEDLVRREGYRFVYRQRATLEKAAAQARETDQRFGVPHRVMDADELAQAEPALRGRLAGAIHWLEPWSVSDPGALVSRYAQLFLQRGGRLVRGDAFTLRARGQGWQVHTDEGELSAPHAVVALGPWSDRLVRSLDYRYPLFVKRGYHRHFQCAQAPRLALLDADRGLVVAPMRQGVRLTTGAEFAALDSPPTPVQVARAQRLANELLELGPPVETEPWVGARPCTGDMLPVMGAAPRHPGLWFNFGHGHQGFTMGPVAGRLLAELIEGTPPVVDAAPYAPARFD
ncbi:NAD(P)/FAD-dependent oxidoreductase [Hydrogenophaga sp. ZJX-1]|uniref:NAD(P)/FAD-dependent oxidoreductase n=1 Tax=Hydrogenophaga sp. ZJX-1 TaxID=3404778 RepID=UPI003B28A4FB